MTDLEALEALVQYEDDAEEAGRLNADDRSTCHRCKRIVDEDHRHPLVLFLLPWSRP